jgi:hypothetical protein
VSAVAQHSRFSASAAACWMACAGALTLQEGRPNPSNIYSAGGTVAHTLLSNYMQHEVPPWASLGQTIEQDGFEIEVDEDMVDRVQTAIDNILELTVGATFVLSETKVNYAKWFDVVPDDEAWGTLDVGAVLPGELQVHDYKDGRGAVDAVGNQQLLLYAGGLYLQVADMIDEPIETIRLFIHQPRISKAPSAWVLTKKELFAWLNGDARNAVQRARLAKAEHLGKGTDPLWASTFLQPGAKQCHWCTAKGICPAARDEVAGTVFMRVAATPEEFATEEAPSPKAFEPEADWLGACLDKVDMIEGWCTAIRAEALQALQAGQEVPSPGGGYKLVQGKKGNRAWRDQAAVEEVFRKQFRLPIDQAYNLKLISPAQAEKLAKPAKEGQPAAPIGPRQWKKVEELIAPRAEGKLHVAPMADPRPAVEVKPLSAEFEPVAPEDDIG